MACWDSVCPRCGRSCGLPRPPPAGAAALVLALTAPTRRKMVEPFHRVEVVGVQPARSVAECWIVELLRTMKAEASSVEWESPADASYCVYCWRDITPNQQRVYCADCGYTFHVAHYRRHVAEWPCPAPRPRPREEVRMVRDFRCWSRTGTRCLGSLALVSGEAVHVAKNQFLHNLHNSALIRPLEELLH